MNKNSLSIALIMSGVSLISTGQIFAQNWPGWRGDGYGISPEKNLPLKWSENEGVKWKTPIPGAGHSSPIVWGNRVFITTGVPEDPSVETFKGGVFMGGDRSKPDASEYAYRVICLDADKGDILWSKAAVRQTPKTRRHTIFASFGSAGLYALDFEGTVLWQRDLGLMRVRTGWGTGSSPILYQSTVSVNCDSDDDSYITALDKATGDPVWRTERNEGVSWGTPFLFKANGRAAVVTNATRRMRGYDADTGKLLWECGGGSRIPVPSPVSTQGLVFLSSGHNMMRQCPIVAVRAEALGDITPPRGQSASDGVAWLHNSGGPYVTSPIAIDEYLYVPLDKGTLTCYEALTGKTVYENQELGTRNTITASPVGADDKIYIQTEDGECYIIKQGPKFELLGVNKLDEVFCASPAVSTGRIYLRGRKHLYCIGK
ncbi:MAG: outer membrane protein assembly factor BamB family protein [Planctomycetota bacterium]|jgi:outer membrane protein assembly factor BamB